MRRILRGRRTHSLVTVLVEVYPCGACAGSLFSSNAHVPMIMEHSCLFSFALFPHFTSKLEVMELSKYRNEFQQALTEELEVANAKVLSVHRMDIRGLLVHR